jgi:hypothetical protein
MPDVAEGLVHRACADWWLPVVNFTRGRRSPGYPGFLVGAEIAAGVAFLRSAGAHKSEMLLALRSGNFAGPDFFRRARADALIVLRHSFPDDFCSRP